jgi:N-methylhydantoinase A/oxoprolinase/acetone carboxylase beta subunit
MRQRQSSSKNLDTEELMSLKLGIDTGGTYTDAVLFDDERGVIGSAKALTTKDDLSAGIREAIEMVLPPVLPDIGLVSISTTLATNAIVEGQGRSVCLLLIGYDPEFWPKCLTWRRLRSPGTLGCVTPHMS